MRSLKVDNVCRISTHDAVRATGLLLFDNVVLTVAEWMSDIYNDSDEHLKCVIYVQFGQRKTIAVDSVVGYECNETFNWALLKLDISAAELAPSTAAITQCALRHQRRVSCHINYTFEYTAEPCVNVYDTKHCDDCNDHIQYITGRFDNSLPISHYSTLLGSVLYDDTNVITGIHTGQYRIRSPGSSRTCMVEYAQPISVIIDRIILQFVLRHRFEDLREYVRTDIHFKRRRGSIKEYVVYNDLKTFQRIVNNMSAHTIQAIDDETKSLGQFFHYFNTSGEITSNITNIIIHMHENRLTARRPIQNEETAQ